MENEDDGLNFEEALARLDKIVDRLEEGDLKLEESLALFEEGQFLARHCAELLEKAELKVEALTSEGEIVEIPTR